MMAEEDLPEEGEGPTIRASRFALLTGSYACYKCGRQTRVSAIGVSDYEELGEEGFTVVDDSTLFTQLGELNPEAEAVVAKHAPWLRFDYSNTAQISYLANHCEHCDALIGAWFVSEPGEAFFPQSEDEVKRLAVEWIEQPFCVVDLGGMQSSWIDSLLVPDRPTKKTLRRGL